MYTLTRMNDENNPGDRWFFVAGLVMLLGLFVLGLHRPFDLPLTGDRAYLLYVSQVAYFTGDIYGNSGFGYTPLGPLIAAVFFAGAGLVTDSSTLVLARLAGMACWLACLLGVLLIGRRFFASTVEPVLMALIFAGFAVVPMMSASNLEPKMLVLLFEILALASAYRGRWLLAGFAVACAAMCWQPAIVVLPALGLFLLFDARPQWLAAAWRFAMGIVLGTLPVIVYLTLSGGWSAFWQQAILRKLEQEGAVVLEQPLHWLSSGLFPRLLSERWIFIAAGVGLTVFVLVTVLGALQRTGRPVARHAVLMLLFTLAWAGFNAMEFQSVPDLIPFLPAVCYWPAYLVWTLRAPAKREVSAPGSATTFRAVLGLGLALGLGTYALLDVPRAPPKFTLADQRQELVPLDALDAAPMVLDFEEYHALNELLLPTKFIRFNRYDDYLIEQTVPGGCAAMVQVIRDAAPGALVIRLRGAKRVDRTGDCAKVVLAELGSREPIMELEISGNLGCHSCTPRKDALRVYSLREWTE